MFYSLLEKILTISWSIWNNRNNILFRKHVFNRAIIFELATRTYHSLFFIVLSLTASPRFAYRSELLKQEENAYQSKLETSTSRLVEMEHNAFRLEPTRSTTITMSIGRTTTKMIKGIDYFIAKTLVIIGRQYEQ